jgi:hypothetical protein
MPTYTALTTLPGQEAAQRLADALEGLEPEPMAVGIVEVEDGSGLWEVGAYFETVPGVAELALLAAAHGARPFAVSEVPETDWVAHVRRELAPVRAGRFHGLRLARCRQGDGRCGAASDRGGDGLRDRASRDDEGVPDRARPAAGRGAAARAGGRRGGGHGGAGHGGGEDGQRHRRGGRHRPGGGGGGGGQCRR